MSTSNLSPRVTYHCTGPSSLLSASWMREASTRSFVDCLGLLARCAFPPNCWTLSWLRSYFPWPMLWHWIWLPWMFREEGIMAYHHTMTTGHFVTWPPLRLLMTWRMKSKTLMSEKNYEGNCELIAAYYCCIFYVMLYLEYLLTESYWVTGRWLILQ